ncbi:MAG: 50S ribosomal protein L25 [Kiritimatiellaeota bacterium]|nr:50S ribosomal protein L25 [Kiritimatiellota bacterium]
MTNKKTPVLEMEARTKCGSAASRRDRKTGKVPAIIYGHGADPKHILLDKKAWTLVSRQDVQIVELKPNSGKNLNVLIKSVQLDFLTGAPKHVDFLEVKMDEIITASIPIHVSGTPIGVTQGGVLEQQIHEIEISCTPLTLPEFIDVDISELEIGDSIHVTDLTFPEGVTSVLETDQTVVQVAMPKAEEEPEVAEEEGVEGEGDKADGDSEETEEENKEDSE